MSDDTNHKGPSKAVAFRQRHRTTVTLPSGEAVTIRKLTAEFLLDIRELFEAHLVADERGTKLQMSSTQRHQYVDALLSRAVVAPRVVPRDQEPGPDELHAEDFGPDLDALVAAVHEFNGHVLAPPFRPAPHESAAAPPGGDVPSAPQPDSQGAVVGPDV